MRCNTRRCCACAIVASPCQCPAVRDLASAPVCSGLPLLCYPCIAPALGCSALPTPCRARLCNAAALPWCALPVPRSAAPSRNHAPHCSAMPLRCIAMPPRFGAPLCRCSAQRGYAMPQPCVADQCTALATKCQALPLPCKPYPALPLRCDALSSHAGAAPNFASAQLHLAVARQGLATPLRPPARGRASTPRTGAAGT